VDALVADQLREELVNVLSSKSSRGLRELTRAVASGFSLGSREQSGADRDQLSQPIGVARTYREEKAPPLVSDEWRECFKLADRFRAVSV